MTAHLREQFTVLLHECRGGKVDADGLQAFLDTIRSVESEGADLERLHTVLCEARLQKTFEEWRTALHRNSRSKRSRAYFSRKRSAKQRLERALRAVIRLHEDSKPRAAHGDGLAAQLYRRDLRRLRNQSEPYRTALTHLLTVDPLFQSPEQPAGNPTLQWLKSTTYPALKAAGVKRIHHTDLLRQLALIQ